LLIEEKQYKNMQKYAEKQFLPYYKDKGIKRRILTR